MMLAVSMIHSLSANGERQENHAHFKTGMVYDIDPE